MSAVATDPSVESCEALVDQINAGTTYQRDVTAIYSEQLIDPLEEIDGLRIDVTTDESETLVETLAVEDRSSHQIRVWIRAKVDDFTSDTINPLKLLVRQVFQQLLDYDSSNGRVKVWECDNAVQETPDKTMLRNAGLFVASILLRVEVEAA